MSKFTDFLNLFKWDPLENSEEEFDVDKALNDNWDKIDMKMKDHINNINTNQTDLKTELSKKANSTINNNVDVLGTTKSTESIGNNQLVFNNGAIFGGTAKDAGLVTRGICGITTPDSKGGCTKDNLYVNFDGGTEYNPNRQIVIQAGTAGEHYGNNLYQFAAARGDAVKGYVDRVISSKANSTDVYTNTEIDKKASDLNASISDKVSKSGDTMTDNLNFGNNTGLTWKEPGYGDKFAIKTDFSGADDNNKLKIQGAVGGAGTDPNLIDLINISGKTGATTFAGNVVSPNFIGKTNGFTWDVTTENTTDTWLLVLNNSKIQYRTVYSVIDSCVKRDGNQQIHGMLTVEALNSPNTYNNNVLTAAPNLYITSTGKIRRVNDTSSKRYKKDIENVKDEELIPERLYDLQVKQFKYKEEYQPNKNDSRYEKNLIGFIAEDVEKVFPIAVDYTEDDNGNKIVDNWNERYIIPPMLKLIQNLKKKIDELEDRIKILEER